MATEIELAIMAAVTGAVTGTVYAIPHSSWFPCGAREPGDPQRVAAAMPCLSATGAAP
jgi:hypothetical protein